MKYLVVSDIHGASDSASFIAEKFKNGGFDYILCLGDVLYHGPRNDLPFSYNPKDVIRILNPLSDKIICVKGNCEAEVDQMVLNFKIHDYYDFKLNNLFVHLEHGHHLDEYDGDADIILSGHTHVPLIEKIDEQIFINPGSITIPKNSSKRGYAILDDKALTLYTIDDEIVKSIKF